MRAVKPWLQGALRESGRWTWERATARSTTSTIWRPGRPCRRKAGSLRYSGRTRGRTWSDIYGLDFIRGLADGSLAERQFAYYLAQDAIYLNGYSRVLSRAAAIAPTEAEQLFWARSAQQCLEVESELHRTWLSTRTVDSAWGR